MLVITGRIPSKKNSKVMSCRGDKPRLFPSAKFKRWHADAMKQLMVQRAKKGIDKCKIELTFFAPDKRIADLTNKAESVMDLLVDDGIITNDSWFMVSEIMLRFGGVDKESPRVIVHVIEDMV